MGEWMFCVHFNARNSREAEDYAAALADLVEEKRWGRTGLAYFDPISGAHKTWAEPAQSTADLKVHRSPL